MIRDEFKNADKKVIAKKANKKIQELGERQYYAKQMTKINDLFSPVKFSTLFCLIAFCIMAAIVVFVWVTTKTMTWQCWMILGITAALAIWTVVWFVFLIPMLKSKVDFYKSELTRISNEYVKKQSGRM